MMRFILTLKIFLTSSAWFNSYLTDRKQTVFVCPAPFSYNGIHQGSVLGPEAVADN